jgi:amidophosphoribosyltransferase
MCGIVGILAQHPVNQDLYDALTILQHRGQDAAGIMTGEFTKIHLRKSNGLVRDVFRENHMRRLKGNIGIGHVRYPTAGTDSVEESQPFYVNSPYGLSLVHNGNLINTKQLAEDLEKTDLRHLNTHSDSEVLLNIFAYELQRVGEAKLSAPALFKALEKVYQRINGAFAVIVMITGYGLVAFRDKFGIRPLVYGKKSTSKGDEFMIASENIALDALGYEIIADVAPGEAVFIDLSGKVSRQICVSNPTLSPCIFEYIYLARPDTVIDRIPVYQARLAMGRKLAEKIQREWLPHDIDVVIPIPDTSRTAAIALAQDLKVTYCEGFVKNRYIGRTFIMPGQKLRRGSVRMKLNAIKAEFNGKNVLLVDDSIVRGTTSKEIVQMARDAGAKKVYFASAAPEVRFPNVYGIDMPSVNDLIAHDRSVDEIAKYIGADKLIFLSLPDVSAAINSAAKNESDKIKRFEDSIFTGEYITGGVDENYFASLAEMRSASSRA